MSDPDSRMLLIRPDVVGESANAEEARRRNPSLDIAFRQRGDVSTEVARDLIEHLLQSGTYHVGDRLPSERQLAQELRVGRSAVREALKSLSLLGLVEIRQGWGAFLRSVHSDLLPRVLDWGLLLSDNTLPDLVEIDGYLEPAIARLAARRRTDDDLAELEALLIAVDQSRDELTMVRTVVAFHVRLASAARNEVLSGLIGNMQAMLEAWTGRVVSEGNGQYLGQDEHRAVYEAVAAGDPDAAGEAMREHIVRGARRLSGILGQDWDLVI